MAIFRRRVLCHKHDGSPFGELFVHKSQAEKELIKKKNPNKFVVREFAMASEESIKSN